MVGGADPENLLYGHRYEAKLYKDGVEEAGQTSFGIRPVDPPGVFYADTGVNLGIVYQWLLNDGETRWLDAYQGGQHRHGLVVTFRQGATYAARPSFSWQGQPITGRAMFVMLDDVEWDDPQPSPPGAEFQLPVGSTFMHILTETFNGVVPSGVRVNGVDYQFQVSTPMMVPLPIVPQGGNLDLTVEYLP